MRRLRKMMVVGLATRPAMRSCVVVGRQMVGKRERVFGGGDTVVRVATSLSRWLQSGPRHGSAEGRELK